MAQFSRLRVPDASSRAGETSPSFAQSTAEFDPDSDLELDGAEGDMQFREAELGGGQAYELKSLVNPAGKKDDGGEDDSFSSRRRMSNSTVSSFQLYTPDEECAVVRKFDRRLVLFVALLFMLSFLDRSNIGNARIAGMDEDLQSQPPWDGWYEWTLTAFYIAYIAFEWMSLLWKLIPAHIYVSLIVLSWGLTAALQSVAVSYPMLICLRVLLGIGEAGFTGIPFYLSFFFKREELAFRTAIFISAAPLATTFASSLAWLIISFAEYGPIAPWRLLFLVEGFPSVLVAVAAWHIIPDTPETAPYLTARERKVARLRLRHQKPHRTRSEKKDPGLKLREVVVILCDPMAWLTAAMFFLTNMAYSSLPVFLPKILHEMGHSRLESQGLSAPPYFLAFLFVLLTAHLSDRFQIRSGPIIFHALASAAGYAVLALSEPFGLPPPLRYLAVYPAAIGFFNVVTLTITWSINNQPSETTMKSENPDAKHFLSIPWAAAHIDAPGTVRETASSRFPKQDTEDELFSTTLHTDKTIAAFLTLYKRPSAAYGENMIREVKALLTLRHGVNGYPNVSHGGIVATILDEVIGLVFPVNKINGLIPDGAYMTAYLNTQYVRPVQTPQTILVVATVKKVEGRKYWIEGVIEDKDGQVLAKAESLYVKVKEKL
ncbi:major facilitator superfamily transporter [Colletotrichum gloeosporioides Cg-14]|uniref:Major facilitator superfamily transporter n=1 Tax=Colletotrichum gloeosporioides (strain Cg-14) TaxID=1237896 RepID=T0K222_COLGC|nr:major facilitator superfamily transporter [Colletotrichum gloeosporioides Cg-14]